MTVLSSIPNGASGKDVRDTINDNITKAATGLANAAAAQTAATNNAQAIAALQSVGLPYLNGAIPISTPGVLPTTVVNALVAISGNGAYTLPAVPAQGGALIVWNRGSGNSTVGSTTVAPNAFLRFISPPGAGAWVLFVDGGAGGTAPAAKTVSVAFLQPSQAEADSGANTIYTARITRTGDLSAAVTVACTFDAGTTNASDYVGNAVPVPGNQTIPANASYVDYAISVKGDNDLEPDETATFSITVPSGYLAGTATSAVMTITNNDTGPKYTHLKFVQTGRADGMNDFARLGELHWQTAPGVFAQSPTYTGSPVLQNSSAWVLANLYDMNAGTVYIGENVSGNCVIIQSGKTGGETFSSALLETTNAAEAWGAIKIYGIVAGSGITPTIDTSAQGQLLVDRTLVTASYVNGMATVGA